jgi:hypothetical protein
MKSMAWIILGSFFLALNACTYSENYKAYSVAQASMAMAQGPLIEFYENGTVKSIGNPMMQMAQISMKPPTSEADAFFSWLTAATPFGAIFGLVGAMTNGLRGNTTNVNGQGNYTGNTSGNQAQMGSPTTTTTTTTTSEESVRINKE